MYVGRLVRTHNSRIQIRTRAASYLTMKLTNASDNESLGPISPSGLAHLVADLFSMKEDPASVEMRSMP